MPWVVPAVPTNTSVWLFPVAFTVDGWIRYDYPYVQGVVGSGAWYVRIDVYSLPGCAAVCRVQPHGVLGTQTAVSAVPLFDLCQAPRWCDYAAPSSNKPARATRISAARCT